MVATGVRVGQTEWVAVDVVVEAHANPIISLSSAQGDGSLFLLQYCDLTPVVWLWPLSEQ